ncbi:MAG: methyltransferase domain-containing protein [Myxococcales bacterium]|nr:methyltransferase domain-containing protein [Myxococcales bacterium]
MSDDHIDRIREQFTRTADVYARLMQATQERGLKGLVKLAGAGAQDHVLDVACGPGFLTMTFATHCAQVTGFDATDAFLELAREEAKRRGLTNIAFEHGNAERLPYDDASFDVVSCRAAYHHFPDPARLLAEMKRVLKSDGRMVIADMLGSEDPERARQHDRLERLCDPTHVRAIPAPELERLFRDAKLTLVHDIRGTLDYELMEWMSHGAPEEPVREQIVALMESWAGTDAADLQVRREDSSLRFTHRTAAFVCTKG